MSDQSIDQFAVSGPTADGSAGAFADPRRASRSESPMARMGMIGGIETEVSVVLGRARLPIKDLLSLGVGSILELDRKPNEPVDVLVNGALIARGEVVIVDDDFGVRITEIVNSTEL